MSAQLVLFPCDGNVKKVICGKHNSRAFQSRLQDVPNVLSRNWLKNRVEGKASHYEDEKTATIL